MAIHCFKNLKKTVSISYNSVIIQRDIISTFTPAVSILCLDFASLILVQTSVDKNPPPSKVSLFYYRPDRITVVFKTDCKWTISELTPNQLTMPFTTKMGDKTYQGERKFLDDSMIETSYIAAKPTVITFKRIK